MSGIKPLIVLVWLAIAGLVLVQNQTPIAVIFLGVSSPMLPLGIWVITAVAIGSLTMFLLAFLLSIGSSGRSQPPRSRLVNDDPTNPAPSSKPPRRRFGKKDEEPIEEPTEVWDDDEAWNDRDRRVSQFVPDLEPPREPWELLENEAPSDPATMPNSTPLTTDYPEPPDDPEDQGEPLNLPPNSRYELHQQPVEVYRQGSVYSFSYEKKPSKSEDTSLHLGENTASRSSNTDRRVPIDLPSRESNPRLDPRDPLDSLEEITPIIEPDDRTDPPRTPARPPRSPRPDQPRNSHATEPAAPVDPANSGSVSDPSVTIRRPPTRPDSAPPDNWDNDWRQPADNDSDWV
jgi:hypothetical protein